MGCSSSKITNSINIKKDNFKIAKKETINDKIISNLNIPKDIVRLDLSCKLKNISDYYSFIQMDLPLLEYLNLSNNNLSNISGLKKLKAPKLKVLDLSNNEIDNIEVFRELTFPLEELYLKGNNINQIKIFEEVDILKKLKKCNITIKDYEKNKESLSSIEKQIEEFKYDINKEVNTKKINKQIYEKKETLKLSTDNN